MELKLKQERIKRNWSQDFVADKIGVTPEMIYYLETNQRKPSYEVLVKLENLSKKSHRHLFAAADETPNLSNK